MKHLPEAPTLWLKPPGDTPRHHPESRFYHPWFPDRRRLLEGGWTETESPAPGWERIALFGGKQKEENRRLLERGRALLHPEGRLYFVLPNEYGGRSFFKRMEPVEEFSGRKSRLVVLGHEASPTPPDLEATEPNSDGFQTAPGLFSWERVDAGSRLLAEVLAGERLRRPVGDLGAGWGFLALGLPAELEVHLFEADRRALKAARENLAGRRASFHWCDVTDPTTLPPELVGRLGCAITNPPFHTGKRADPVLGGAFVASARALLKTGGSLYMVGNVHLPYQRVLEAYFPTVEVVLREGGYNILRGRS